MDSMLSQKVELPSFLSCFNCIKPPQVLHELPPAPIPVAISRPREPPKFKALTSVRHSVQWSNYQTEAQAIRDLYHDLIQQGIFLKIVR
jgi:hypothetical protein